MIREEQPLASIAFEVDARIGAVEFTTSLFPKDGGYLLPVKVAVQKAEGIGLGDTVFVTMEIKNR